MESLVFTIMIVNVILIYSLKTVNLYKLYVSKMIGTQFGTTMSPIKANTPLPSSG